jgi:hypothetical protein
MMRKWQDLSSVIFNNFGLGHGHTKSTRMEEKIGIKELFERFRGMVESLGLKEVSEAFDANLSELGKMDEHGDYRVPEKTGEHKAIETET